MWATRPRLLAVAQATSRKAREVAHPQLFCVHVPRTTPRYTLHADVAHPPFKYLDKKVEKHSGLSDSGFALMMDAFNSKNPKIKLTALKTQSEEDEQEGYRFVFAGGIRAIRNPRGHEFSVVDDPDKCLDHLSFVSMLLRRLEQSGFVLGEAYLVG